MTPDCDVMRFEVGFFLKSRFSSAHPDMLYRPSFVKYDGDDDYDLVLAEVCAEHINELICYYESLFSYIDKYSERYHKQHLWLRPGLFCGDEMLFGFPWYDRLIDITRLFNELKEKDEGTLFATGDQGWYFEIFQFNDKLLFYETSQEDEMDFSIDDFDERLFLQDKKYHFDFDEFGFVEYTWAWEYKDALLQQIKKKILMTRDIIGKLTAHFKSDYWSSY